MAFKAPVFWEADPALWFAQVESQFAISGITVDSTKFHAVVAALEPKVLSCVRDLITNPPSGTAYADLKARILAFYEQSSYTKLRLVLSDLPLGDQRPSQLLCQMEGLNEGKLKPDALRAVWIQRLPKTVQQILSCCDEIDDNSKLARVADKIYEKSQTGSAGISDIADDDTVAGLRKQIAELTTALKAKSSNRDRVSRSTSRRRSYSKQRSNQSSRSSSPSKRTAYCWYHSTFQDRARKCKPGCKWPGPEN